MIFFLLSCTLLISEHNYVLNQIICWENNWEKVSQKGLGGRLRKGIYGLFKHALAA